MASITKRGAYQFQVLIRRTGYEKQCKTFETLQDAEAWARSIESRMDTGVFISSREADSTTLGEALQRYGVEVTPNKRAYTSELNRIKYWQKHPLALRPLSKIRSKDIAEYIAERQQHTFVRNGKTYHLSNNTIRLELAVISHVFTVAMKRWGMETLDNPVKKTEIPRPAPGRIRRLEGNEQERLLEACAKTRAGTSWLSFAVNLALFTGMRACEILSIEWRQVRLEQRYIALNLDENGSCRDVPLSTKAVALLQAIPHTDSSRVIPAFGCTENLDGEFRQAVNIANIENLKFHDLRHEAASQAAKVLLPQELAKAYGWVSLQMIMRYYHPTAYELASKLG